MAPGSVVSSPLYKQLEYWKVKAMLSNDPVKVSWEHLISDKPLSEQNRVSDAVAESSPLLR